SVAPRFWVPYDTVYSVEKNEDRRTAERFQKWVEMGVLTVTDGAEVDYRYILEEVKAANKISPVSESPIDPFGATGLSHDLADEDLNPVTIIQNYTNMSDPMKELEAAIESGRFHHDGNPIMTWCIGNVVGKTIPGNYLWRPGLELGQPSSLAGYGIAENEQMPDIAADAKAIAFGNFKRGYTIVDRIGTRILRDPYTNKPFVGFYTTKRTGGMLVDSQAIKLLKIAAA
ncbi:phage major capsid protein, partial [Escherichia coli]